MRLARNFIFVICFCLIATIASATPAFKNTKILWDDYSDPEGVGYFLYWAKANEPSPRLYDDTRRVDIGPNASETIITATLSEISVKGRMCFKLTAYDVLKDESDFSNEACGFFGVPSPKKLQVE
jgi:hypothetical protein